MAASRYDGNGVVEALIDRRRDGTRVRFAKSYDGSDKDYDLVRYEGRIDGERLEITGHWAIPGTWSGTFIMVRQDRADTMIAVAAGETVDC